MFRLGLVFTMLIVSYRLSAQEADPQFKDPQNIKIAPENTDCHTLPASFQSLSEATEKLENTRFYYDQRIRTTRKSGLMQARFVSCDFNTGYLIIKYNGNDMVYPDIKKELWEAFQQTPDIDGYYLKNIEHLNKLDDQ
ncbi:MAG: hypothetical protein DHS20C17_12850 [Cyclobacteriaceae bacterium]|nr:MAG: hypothetical protein DHS20C17_12850 [Cyclobacteriaceae bacterium]